MDAGPAAGGRADLPRDASRIIARQSGVERLPYLRRVHGYVNVEAHFPETACGGQLVREVLGNQIEAIHIFTKVEK